MKKPEIYANQATLARGFDFIENKYLPEDFIVMRVGNKIYTINTTNGAGCVFEDKDVLFSIPLQVVVYHNEKTQTKKT